VALATWLVSKSGTRRKTRANGEYLSGPLADGIFLVITSMSCFTHIFSVFPAVWNFVSNSLVSWVALCLVFLWCVCPFTEVLSEIRFEVTRKVEGRAPASG